jgi:hypothetical protein
VLIDAIVRNGSSAAPEEPHIPPPRGFRSNEEDRDGEEARRGASEEKQTYTEDQRQGVFRYLPLSIKSHSHCLYLSFSIFYLVIGHHSV